MTSPLPVPDWGIICIDAAYIRYYNPHSSRQHCQQRRERASSLAAQLSEEGGES